MATEPSPDAIETVEDRAKPPFLRRVRIRGYKSIAFCDVTLEPLTILVGRNASGKSNFLDAFAFLRDVVVKGVHEAVKLHGGRDAVRCRLTDASRVCIEIEAGYEPQGEAEPWTAQFAVEIDLHHKSNPRIVREYLRLWGAKTSRWTGRYTVEGGRVGWSGGSNVQPIFEWPNADRALLGVYGVSLSPFLELLERVESIRTYNFNPETIRPPQKPAPGGFLERDGRNLASVIETTRENEEEIIERVGRYLTAITETVEFGGVNRPGEYETLRFRILGGAHRQEFDAPSMSDGTLRAFAALVAAFQNVRPYGHPSLVAIEEPETSLHPAAMRALVDALDEATLRTQILLTTHSADMLDNPTIRPKNIRVVQMIDGQTVIGPVDEASVEIVGKNLDTLGGLERQNQLELDLDDLDRQKRLAQNGQEPKE